MAAVAGAVAEAVGTSRQRFSDSVIVENGGDCYLNLREETSVGIFAGPHSPFTGKIALKLGPHRFPLGVCTSSATLGPSLSFGNADAVIVLSPNTALADAAATRPGNMVKTASDIDQALALAPSIPSVEAVLIAIKDKIGIWGNVEGPRADSHSEDSGLAKNKRRDYVVDFNPPGVSFREHDSPWLNAYAERILGR
ncbi:MAG: UPF0280 family protein [Syntrophobacteraceae bacterium]|nr:UPF0280 family protein [Syntrophobacteraceae bacterium]